jgi:hypothetical protein
MVISLRELTATITAKGARSWMPTMNSLVDGANLKRGANAVRNILPYI